MGGLNINNTDNHGMIFVLKKKKDQFILSVQLFFITGTIYIVFKHERTVKIICNFIHHTS